MATECEQLIARPGGQEDRAISASDESDETGVQAKPKITVSPRVSETAERPKKEWQIAETALDPLAQSLSDLMRVKGRDVAVPTLRAGLPLPNDGRLTPELAVIAAEGQGFRAMLTRRADLTKLPDAVLPTVLFLKGRDACVLVSREAGGRARVIWPARGPEAITMPMGAIEKAYAGHALVLQDDSAEQATEQSDSRAMGRHWFWGTVSRHWPDYMQVILASIVVNLLALVVPLFTMNVYDRVFPNAAIVTLWSLVAGVGIALTLDAALKWLRAGIIDRVGRRVDLSVSSALFRHIADLKLEAQNRTTGALMNTLKDYEQVRDFFGSQTVASLTDLCFSVLFIAVIAYIGGPLAIPPTIALTATLIVGLLVLIPLRRASNAARQSGGTKNAVAVEAMTDLETLKAVAGQGRMQRRWENQVTESAMAQERSRRLATFATTVTALFQQLSSIGIVVVGVYLALEGQITMGAVIAAMILSGRALAPTAALSGLFLRGSYAFSTLRSLNEVMGLASDASPEARVLNAKVQTGAITLDKATLRYPQTEADAVSDISLQVAGGERVAVIGPIGAGKTSLVRLMSGLYAPTDGMVLLDGTNMRQLGAAQIRSEVQLVPQDAVLFSGTLAENIAFGVPQARDADILAAARIAGVDRLAASHPDGFAMQITERGRNLSGGQRQMVALARALLPKPRVLILDEPTSSMDQASERLFIQRLSVALKARRMTLVVATHRMGLLDLVGRLVVLEDGRVTRDGPRKEVVAQLEQIAREKRS